MRRLLMTCTFAALAAAFAPSALGADLARVTVVDLVGGPARGLPRSDEQRFTLAGVHWRGPGRVVLRARSLAGHWSPWRDAAPEDEDRPDPGSSELRRRAGWRVGNPWWVGPSERLQVRTIGRVTRARAYLVWSPELRVPYRTLAATETPAIVPRLSWGANESIRRSPPAYAPDVRFAVVHHTAGRNDYTRAEAPAIVRGIQLYHVQGNGWNDIGYNFLVDRFGTIYEGRFGGIEGNVVGAHAQGFNTGSVGVALLGTYGSAGPSQAAQDAIARLLAWRLDLAHIDPTGLLTVISGGSDRFANGIPVPLRTVSGHRDTGFTECPGDTLYARLNELATTALQTGGPKIFEPWVETIGSSHVFRARLSSSLPWSVVVADAAGVEVARGSGYETAVDWTWDGASVPDGTYSWAVSAGSARPAAGTLRAGGASELAIEGAAVEPEAISPNGDGQADSAVLTYRLASSANVTVEIVDTIGGVVATLVDRVWTRAGEGSVTVGGNDLPDGRFNVVVTARSAAGEEVQRVVPLAVTRTLGLVSVSPAAFSPNGDGRKDRVTVHFSLTAPAEVRVRVMREGRGVVGLLSTSLFAGEQRVVWNGERAAGPVRDGTYSAVVDVRDAVGPISVALPFVADTTAPTVRVLPGRRLGLELSEPVLVLLRVDGRVLRREVKSAGVVRLPWGSAPKRVRAVVWDGAGNVSTPVVWSRPVKAPRSEK